MPTAMLTDFNVVKRTDDKKKVLFAFKITYGQDGGVIGVNYTSNGKLDTPCGMGGMKTIIMSAIAREDTPLYLEGKVFTRFSSKLMLGLFSFEVKLDGDDGFNMSDVTYLNENTPQGVSHLIALLTHLS